MIVGFLPSISLSPFGLLSGSDKVDMGIIQQVIYASVLNSKSGLLLMDLEETTMVINTWTREVFIDVSLYLQPHHNNTSLMYCSDEAVSTAKRQ